MRGLDLNQRPLGYERVKVMSGNPLISREMHVLAGSSLVVRSCIILAPISACFGVLWEQHGSSDPRSENRVSQPRAYAPGILIAIVS